MDEHLRAHYAFYGDYLGVRTARKHIGWYVRELPGGEEFRQQMNLLEDCERSCGSRRFLRITIGVWRAVTIPAAAITPTVATGSLIRVMPNQPEPTPA